MPRILYHITDSVNQPGSTKADPQTWINVGTVKSVLYEETAISSEKTLSVNTAENFETDLKLTNATEVVCETEGRIVYVYGYEGAKFITDDGL